MISDTKTLDALFNEIGKELDENTTIYVFGGAALMFSGLKDATKDIDIVLATKKEMEKFTGAIKNLGFKTTPITGQYKYLKLEGIYTRKEDRFDIFLKQICGNLALSEEMKIRSKPKADYGNLSVKVLSGEYIFLLKSIFSRAGDYEDCVALFQAGLDWNIIYQEITRQCKDNPVNVWKSHLLTRIEDMQKRAHIQVPIYNKLLEEYEQETFPHLAIFLELSKADLSYKELLKKTELDEYLLKRTLLLLTKKKRIEKSDEKYTLKVQNIRGFLSP